VEERLDPKARRDRKDQQVLLVRKVRLGRKVRQVLLEDRPGYRVQRVHKVRPVLKASPGRKAGRVQQVPRGLSARQAPPV